MVPLENREFNYRKVCYGCSVDMKVLMPPKESCLEVLCYFCDKSWNNV